MEQAMIFVDVVIVGGGLAGLFTALNIAGDRSILIVQKSDLSHSNSMLAQGGIAAELTNDPELLEQHIQDTLKAGSHLNNVEAVTLLVKQAKTAIDRLIAFGTPFDRDKDNELSMTKEGGHSTRRILHAGGDASGYHATKSLIDRVALAPNIRVLTETMVLDVVKDKHGAAVGLDVLTEDGTHRIFAQEIVLCTGGIGSVYATTTNDLSATGDGIGIASRAGAIIENMEFVQFHPTALFQDNVKERQRFLISEAVRGEGAYLVNVLEQRFMTKYDSVRMELAPRDVVSQAIMREMYDTWTDHVYLDTRHLDAKALERRFPTIFKHCKSQGYVMGVDLIPVAPCEHFSCGGVKTDLDGRTSVPHLYAVGEVASTGVHGANRLASNSLLECLVFGLQAANAINRTPSVRPLEPTSERTPHPAYNFNYKPIRKKIGDYMDEHVGIVRNAEGLTLTHDVLRVIRDNLLKYPNDVAAYYETLNLVTTALFITEQALNRKGSIGCHLRIR
jgi:L-aspartate oxidase